MSRCHPLLTVQSIVVSTIILSGCGGSDGPTPNELRVTQLSVSTPATDRQVGHPLEVAAEIEALAPAANVSIVFVALLKADVDAQKDEIVQHVLGGTSFDLVQAGVATYSATLSIPPDLQPAGDYYLVSDLDPHDTIYETNKDDNRYSQETVHDTPFTILEDRSAEPDIVLDAVELKDQVMMLDEPPLHPVNPYTKQLGPGAQTVIEDEKNSDGSLTIELRASGRDVLLDVEVEVSLELPAGTRYFEVWETPDTDDPGSYRSGYALDRLVPGDRACVHLDLVVPDSWRDELKTLVQQDPLQSFPLTVWVNRSGGYVEFEEAIIVPGRAAAGEDNRLTVPAHFVTPAPSDPPNRMEYAREWRKTWEDSWFCGAELQASSAGAIDRSEATSLTEFAVPVTIVGQTFDFMSGSVMAFRNFPACDDWGVVFDLEFVGTTILHWDARDHAVNGEINDAEISLPVFTKSYPGKGKCLQGGDPDEPGYCKLVLVGHVPVLMKVMATGNIGLFGRATVRQDCGVSNPDIGTYEHKLAAGPYAELVVEATGSVPIPVIEPGIGGELTIVRWELEASVNFDAEYDTTSSTPLTVDYHYDLAEIVSGLQGRIFAFIHYPFIKVGWWYFKAVIKRKDFTIVKWPGLEKRDVLKSIQTPLGPF